MSPIERPSPGQKARRWVTLGLAIAAPLVAYLQLWLGLGQTPQAFSADSDATLQVAGYAFSIWGVIYAWLLVHAVRLVLPSTGESELLTRLGWPTVAALALITLWIPAMAADLEWLTVVLIFAAAFTLGGALMAAGADIRALSARDPDRWFAVWPLAMLAGWLCIAAPVNLLTVLTGNGQLPSALPPLAWALVAVVAVSFVALAMTARIRVMAYGLPVAWGLIGVFAAEQPDNPVLAFAALAAALVILGASAIMAFRLTRRVERKV